jgi:hypothetical protein
MLEIIGVDYPALREQLFLAEGLSTEQLEVRILEGTERLDFERAQGTKAKGLIFRRGDGTLTLKAFL